MSEGTLNVYGQRYPHATAYIVGDAEALRALRDAIDTALADKHGCAHTFTSDGEGYDVIVLHLPSDEAEKLITPYTDDNECDWRDDENVLRPWDIDLGAND